MPVPPVEPAPSPNLSGVARALCVGVGLLAGTLLPAGGSAWAAGAGASSAAETLRAARAVGPIRIDGQLDEAAWQQAPVFDAFVQLFPTSGAPPSERTEVRILYSDRYLYVGFRCFDSQPQGIVARLGPRDSPPASDLVQIAIDSGLTHQTAYVFAVNSGGVLQDGMLFDDSQFTKDWDVVWDARTSRDATGWSAEMMIPLHVLKFPRQAEQEWGFGAKREISRTHETLLSVNLPRGENALTSRLGHLVGLRDIVPERDLELTPYAATRATVRPIDEDVPAARLFEPSIDLGLDVRAALTSDLTLNATVNPDFGQVEADQLVFNLTNFEAFFPEKRPFFTQGLELFQPVGTQEGNNNQSPQGLFYSRRIGLDAPILAAAKLTGSLGPKVDVGVVDALVASASVPAPEDGSLDHRWRLHPERPLHFGANHELPEVALPTRNFLAAVARTRTGPHAFGATVTSVEPLSGGCPPGTDPEECPSPGSAAAAADFNLRTSDGRYVALGQIDGSLVTRGPAERILSDGTVLRPRDTGFGGFLRAGKMGGEPFRFQVDYNYATPKLDLNQAGFQQTQNKQGLSGNVFLVKPNGLGPLHHFTWRLGAESSWTTDGRGVQRMWGVSTEANALLPGFHFLGLGTGFENPMADVREVGNTGIPYRRHPVHFAFCYGGTDPSLPASIEGFFAVGHHLPAGPSKRAVGYTADITGSWRPHPNLQTRLTVGTDRTPAGPRFYDELEPGRFLFGDLDARFLSLTLRQQVLLTPRLSILGYAQLFGSFSHHRAFYEARSEGTPILPGDLEPVDRLAEVEHSGALNLSAVLRWDYRLGSSLYVVYSRQQSEGSVPEGEVVPTSVFPFRLAQGPATDIFLVKLSYWFDV